MGDIRCTYAEPTQMMDSLEQLHVEGHLNTFFPAWTGASTQSNTAEITAHCRAEESIAPGWFTCVSRERRDLSYTESSLHHQMQH